MLAAREAHLRRVGLVEHQVPHQAEARGSPGIDEQIGLVPAVEADAECPWPQEPVHLGEGGAKPFGGVVAGELAAGAVAIAGDVGRVRQHKVHAGAGEAGHHLGAVIMKHCVAGEVLPADRASPLRLVFSEVIAISFGLLADAPKDGSNEPGDEGRLVLLNTGA